MNIGVDIRSLMSENRTGVGEYAFELLRAVFLIDKENQYYLFYNSYYDVSKNIPQWHQANVHYVNTHYPNKLFNVALFFLKKPELDKDVDVWFSPNLNFTALSKRTKFVLTVHDLSFEFLPDCYSPKQRLKHYLIKAKKQCERADLILTPSENTKRDIIDCYRIDAKKIEVLYPGLSISREDGTGSMIKKKYNLPDKYILFLATIEPRKNLFSLLEAYQKSNLIRSGYSLMIAGGLGWQSEKAIKIIEKTPGAVYLGYVETSEKFWLYQQSSLFVYPSLYEGFGFPVLEAMSVGVPVITSNRSSLPEVVKAKSYLVDPYNICEIMAGFSNILNNQELKERLIKEGKCLADTYHWRQTAQEFLKQLKNS